MKRCPSCNRTFTDVSLNFCLEDGTPLVRDTGIDPAATIRYDSRETNPPATEIYPPRPTTPVPSAPRPTVRREVPPSTPHDQWSPLPTMPQARKSNAIWWVLGGILVAAVIVVGLSVMILALLGMDSNSNANTNANVRNTNSRANRNSNTVNASNANNANANVNGTLPSSLIDDFSEVKWGNGNFSYGNISYSDGEYRMKAKENSYLVMYAPTSDYSTENSTVRVTVHDVDGGAVPTGYGLIVHGQKTAASQLQDYALLIYTGAQPKYEIIKHKAGVQTTVVPWTSSKAILSGTNTNQLEVRAKGSELSFYINGQFVKRITDNELKKGVAGFYTSGTSEVAFDDLVITRSPATDDARPTTDRR